MTILMTRILLSPRFLAGERQRLAANLAVIAASNVGANYTLIGSLAAVMWLKLLKACAENLNPQLPDIYCYRLVFSRRLKQSSLYWQQSSFQPG